MNEGIEVYEIDKYVLHSKYVVVDEMFTMIGSFNIDFLSSRRLSDSCSFFNNKKLSVHMKNSFDYELMNSKRIKLEEIQSQLTFFQSITLDVIRWFFAKF
jgi:cardiolipin synthase A/B